MVKPGDRIIMLTPVYYPFFEAAQRNGIGVSASQLIYRNQRYEIDFDDFEKKAKEPEVKMFYFCSPHNPGGRLWTREEIERLGMICIENGIIIVSDEIHSDLLMPGERHIVTASVSREISDNSITFIAPSKTFNLAGLQTSLIMIPNPSLKDIFDRFIARLGIKRPNVFGISALMASYEYGDEWLDQLLIYLKNNVECVKEYLSEHIPEAKMMIPQAGYLVWIDFSGLKLDPKEFHEALLKTSKIWLDEGYMFGEPGYGFERINVACPRSVLIDGLKRIKKTIDYLRK
jgi:cystathionine beta-lyase